MLDCVIVGGDLVDGTGAPRRRADVGIRDGRVVALGQVDEDAARVIDADGRVVAPGFIDVHTHYDAQVMWDAAVSPSSLHGVTTVMGGNCGFTIAPVDEGSADYVMRMLACVEGMPVESLEVALQFGWRSFGEWLGRLDGTLALNAGFLVGHSTVRRLVMGERAHEAATEDDLTRMAAIVDESVRDGALGFSSSWGISHSDHLGNMVPSRHADTAELAMLASVLRDHPGTQVEFVPPNTLSWTDEVVEAMIAMALGANKGLNWNLLSVGVGRDADSNAARLGVADEAARRGAEIVALLAPVPFQLRLNLMTTILYNRMPTWKGVLALPFGDRLRALTDTSTRARLAEAIAEAQRTMPSVFLDFEDLTVESVDSPALGPLEGRVVGEIARERGVSAIDAFFDIAVADGLLTSFRTPLAGDDDDSWQQRAALWRDPRVLVGGSDAGAHLDMVSTFGLYSDFVGPTVRERELLSLEDAVHKITDAPAQLYGLRDRGRLTTGAHADIVVFDPATVGTGDVVLRGDMPNNAYRLFADAVGVEHVLVNGTEIVDHGTLTGATPGTILRSGRDTMPRPMRRRP